MIRRKCRPKTRKEEGYFFPDQLSEVTNFEHNPMGPFYDIRKETYVFNSFNRLIIYRNSAKGY